MSGRPQSRSLSCFMATVASDKANIYGLSICGIRAKSGEVEVEAEREGKGQQKAVSRRSRLVPRRHMLLQTPQGCSRFN